MPNLNTGKRPNLTPRARRLAARTNVYNSLAELTKAEAEAVADGLPDDSEVMCAIRAAFRALTRVKKSMRRNHVWGDPSVPPLPAPAR